MRYDSSVILTSDRLAETVKYFMSTDDPFSWDLETTGQHRGVPKHNTASWIGLATRGRVAAIPMGHPIGSRKVGETKEPRTDKTGKTKMFRVPVWDAPPTQLSREEVFEALRPLFWSGKLTITHGGSFDLASIAKYYGDEIPEGPHVDTIVLRWLLDENRLTYRLKQVTKDIYKYPYDDEDVGKQCEKYPLGMVAQYLRCDVIFPLLEYYKLRPLIDDHDLQEVYDLEMSLLPVKARQRLTGVMVDVPRLEQMRTDLTPKVQRVEASIYAAAGREFKLNYYKDKAEVLYLPKDKRGQGLKPWRLTETARDKQKKDPDFKPGLYDWSTDAQALESYVGNPVVDAILTYQEWSKLLNGYVISYLGDPSDKKKPGHIFDGHIYPDFVQYGTVTGRESCRDPNLQNVGRPDTELGKLIRGAFIAEPGRKLIVADYDQIELVVLAHYLGQGKLYEGLLNGVDPHTMTAAMVLGKRPEDVTKPERQLFGKSINFAVVYGAGDNKVASMMKKSIKETRHFLGQHADEFPEIYGFKEYTLDKCRETGYIRTLFGRYRRVPGIRSKDKGLRLYCERQAFNALCQGGSADILKLAQVRLSQTMPAWMRYHLDVHDELVCSAPVDLVDQGQRVLLDAMTGPGIGDILRVPLKSDCAVVHRWSQAK